MSLLYLRLFLDKRCIFSIPVALVPLVQLPEWIRFQLLCQLFYFLHERILSSIPDPFLNHHQCSRYMLPISHSYNMYSYQEYYIPTTSRYWWGIAIPSIPTKGCTNACLLHSPPEWLLRDTHSSGDQSDFMCHGVHWRMLRRFSTRPFRTVTVPFVCTRVIS